MSETERELREYIARLEQCIEAAGAVIRERGKTTASRILHERASNDAKEDVGGETPLADVRMSTRLFSALTNAGIRTLERAASFSDEELLELRNFGPVALAELREIAARENGAC